MWYPIKDYSLKEAKEFLRKDFIKVVKRTKYLYVECKPRKNIGYGFFEPIVLCLSWCDFLGALYCGSGKQISKGGLGNTERSKTFINEILGNINPKYKEASQELVKMYRNGTVHAYAPSGGFDIRINDTSEHLNKNNNKKLIISIEQFVNDMIEGTNYFAKLLHLNSKTMCYGSLVAFNKGRSELE
ncbi:MAG TPA: hypothetical protein ENJ28_09310 [Gammaproteobacteria bacterium]|nr:hypothetical protein [Gammaproteobacteria bacterium]